MPMELEYLLRCIESTQELGHEEAAFQLGIKISTLERYLREARERFGIDLNSDVEMIKSNVKYKQETLRARDTNRIERKTFREFARVSNAVQEYQKEIIKIIKENNFAETKKHTIKNSKASGIIHLTDTHFNELVNMEGYNYYDFSVASKRLYKFANESIKIFKLYNIENVLIAMTGDMLNSDARLDKLLNAATNRAKATFVGADLLRSFIFHINQHFNVSVAAVSGNESRIGDEVGYTDMLVTDNYDFTIFQILKLIFEDKPGIKFADFGGKEQDIIVGNKRILLMHGNETTLRGDVEKGISQLMGKYADKGKKIDFVIFGHIHYARIGDKFGRGSSLVGANDYSDKGLHLISRASQNIHIITKEGDIHSIKIDLQNTTNEKYDFNKALEAYNPKSAGKLKQTTKIMEIVI